MKLNQQDLQKIADLTLEHYNRRADDFWEGTRDHDVSQNVASLLRFIENEPPFTILDFGCGPGRDLKTFAERGHIAIGLDGAAHFAPDDLYRSVRRRPYPRPKHRLKFIADAASAGRRSQTFPYRQG